jgi:hypothetical protein
LTSVLRRTALRSRGRIASLLSPENMRLAPFDFFTFYSGAAFSVQMCINTAVIEQILTLDICMIISKCSQLE